MLMQIYQDDIDKFNGSDGSVPPCCEMSLYGFFDPKTKTLLHYPVSLDGIECPVTLYIHKVFKSTLPTAPSITIGLVFIIVIHILIVIPYTGLVYCERKEDKYLMGFVAATARNLKSLVEVIYTMLDQFCLSFFIMQCIENQHSSADIVKLVNFDFDSNPGCIKLHFCATSQKSFISWTAEPQSCEVTSVLCVF